MADESGRIHAWYNWSRIKTRHRSFSVAGIDVVSAGRAPIAINLRISSSVNFGPLTSIDRLISRSLIFEVSGGFTISRFRFSGLRSTIFLLIWISRLFGGFFSAGSKSGSGFSSSAFGCSFSSGTAFGCVSSSAGGTATVKSVRMSISFCSGFRNVATLAATIAAKSARWKMPEYRSLRFNARFSCSSSSKVFPIFGEYNCMPRIVS